MRMLQTRAPGIFSVVVFMLMRFPLFTTGHTNMICTRFRFDPPQERFQIDAFSMKTLSVLVWTQGLRKRIEMSAFSNENALVWTAGALVNISFNFRF